jgi:GNAT superfamily N-acetyltransferase
MEEAIKEAKGIRFSMRKGDEEIARTFLYVMFNDLHGDPFGLMEDLYVDESYRGQGIGSELVERVISRAEEEGCYKLICTSRYPKVSVHKLYEKLGFTDHGKEFRIDFEIKLK